MMPTDIEWADDSANAATGCEEARLADGSMSPECAHCYARLMSARQEAMGNHIYDGVAERKGGSAIWTGVFRWDLEMLRKRFEAMRPGHRVFFGSMTDLWHPSHSEDLRAALAKEIRLLEHRRYGRPKVITLTKRAPELLAWQREFFPEGLPAWHWAGVTAGVQASANERIPTLLKVLARGPRVVSVEPLLGAVDIAKYLPRVVGPWSKAPPTWSDVQWPEWVPPEIRKQISGFWSESYGRSPAEYERSIRQDGYYDIPPFGARVAMPELSRESLVEGRYIHAWNNIGRVVRDDGTSECVSVRSQVSPPTDGKIGRYALSTIGWVIVGGESGSKARPMHPDWARSIRDQCVSAGVPFFFKQWGEWAPWLNEAHFTHGDKEKHPHAWVDGKTGDHGHAWLTDGDGLWSNWTGDPRGCDSPPNVDGESTLAPEITVMGRVGKAAAGRMLDGRTWDEVPQ